MQLPESVKFFIQGNSKRYFTFKHYLEHEDIDQFLEEYLEFIHYKKILEENKQLQCDKKEYEKTIEKLSSQIEKLKAQKKLFDAAIY
jgi:DNA-binding transcriptional MerR regulator